MSRTVLLVNSDLAANRGDRAIAEGIVQLVREHMPDAVVTGLSEQPQRDAGWYGIKFLDMNFQSLNPLDLVRFLREARRSDVILWGGGEILKDYTNKAALWYWVSKMSAVSLVNRRVIGAYQGIGPTASPSSRRLIAFIVNRCEHFIVRDHESRNKLVAWGADPQKITAASDPALLPAPHAPDAELLSKLKAEYQIDEKFLENFVCIGPRDWFHYKPGGILPYKYVRRIRPNRANVDDDRHSKYVDNLHGLVSEILAQSNANILLAPMHLGESDTELCSELQSRSTEKDRIRILDKDLLSPSEFRSVVGRAQSMVGFRLHSNIIGTSAAVPCINVYYVDKGRVYFEQIAQEKHALPIEEALRESFPADIAQRVAGLADSHEEITAQIAHATKGLRETIHTAFTRVASPK